MLLFGILITGMLAAQKTQIKVRSFNEFPLQEIEVYSGQKLLGNCDANGFFGTDNNLVVSGILLQRNQIHLNWELIDSAVARTASGMELKTYNIQILPDKIEEVLVRATRASDKDPFARNEVQKTDLEVQNTGRDLPVMLQYQPSVITTSDAGNSVGYTGIRVRGSDASRTNITVNGVPINDAESQGTFWVNMPDLASSVQNIQIQRGAGSSTNGAGAFGATVNIQTATGFKPYGNLSNSFGSYGTQKSTLSTGTGLLQGHWTMDMRLSSVKSNGYIDRANSNLSSYFVSTAYYGRKWSLKFLHFSGSEKTYQAWWGIPREKLSGTDSALKNHYFRNAGLDYTYRNYSDSVNLFRSNSRTYNYYTYENETDNYKQAHYHLYFNYNFNVKNSLNATLYRTNGAGYFEQWRPLDKLNKYGMQNVIFGSDTFDRSDLIRRRWLDNTLTGFIGNYRYSGKKLQLTAGAAYSQYLGNHFGELIWARLAPGAEYQGHYYEATGDKFDGNIFVKSNYLLNPKTNIFVDLQYRKVHHEGSGLDNDRRQIHFRGDYGFFNPKAGISYTDTKLGMFYLSAAVANKEPSRSDFTDNPYSKTPKPESLLDVELGWNLKRNKWNSAINFYYMAYQNQLVPTGAVNDVGTPLRTNVKESYRAGLELTGAYVFSSKFSVNGNITCSQNQIKSIQIVTMDYFDGSTKDTTLNQVPIAFSPAITAAISLIYSPGKNWSILWNHKYVGKQYLDNSGDEDKTIKAYYFSELWINKRWNFKNFYIDGKFQVLNMFNTLYNNNGYTFEYKYAGALTREVYLFPSAPRNFMAGIVLGF